MSIYAIILWYTPIIACFNLETKNDVWKFSNPGPKLAASNFGFQVLLHTKDIPRVLISAPDVNNTGAVFVCNADDRNNCKKLDAEKETSADSEKTRRQRQKQWFGMSMSENGESTMTCAPLWHQERESKRGKQLWYLGRCSLMDSKLSRVLYTESAGEDQLKTLVFHGYCLSGFSTTGTDIMGNRAYYLGAPGSYNFTGALFGLFGGSKYSSPTIIVSEDQRKTLEDINSYMGYSIASGRLTGLPYDNIVTGAPRAKGLLGIVIVFSVISKPKTAFQLEYYCTNPDKQIGSYFGASVCVVDLNNDGKDDLLVGAPFYSKMRDEGRVYVYMNTEDFVGLDYDGEPLEPDSNIKAGFGTTIANIGDLNKDGCSDVAIGAPNGGPDGNGAVYIYNGGQNGLHRTPSQVLHEEMNAANRGFGLAISGRRDMDGNAYPDIIVGSPVDGTAFLYRTRPVLTLSDNLQTNTTQIPFETENSNCIGPDGLKYYCIEFKVNLQYAENGSLDAFEVEVTMTTDQQVLQKRGFFFQQSTKKLVGSISRNFTLLKGVVFPLQTVVFITTLGNFDVKNPIQITATYKYYDEVGGCGDTPCPIIDVYGATSSNVQVSYLRRCGSDDLCRPDLSTSANLILVNTTQQSVLLYGAVHEIELHSVVTNHGENAYQSNMAINFTSDLHIIGVSRNGEPYPLWIKTTMNQTTEQISFPLGNPITANHSVKILVRFSVWKTRPSFKVYHFSLLAESTDSDVNNDNNGVVVSIPTKVETCINVQGVVSPSTVIVHNHAQNAEQSNFLKHTFYVENSGETAVDNLLAEVEMVVEKDGLILFEVIEMKMDEVLCNPKENRFVEANSKESLAAKTGSKYLKDCPGGTCRIFTCIIKQIEPKEGVIITMGTNFLTKNYAELFSGSANVVTHIGIKYAGPTADRKVQRSECHIEAEVKLRINQAKKIAVEWWIILLSIFGALLLLALVIFILYKVGFFKRRRRSEDITDPSKLLDDKED